MATKKKQEDAIPKKTRGVFKNRIVKTAMVSPMDIKPHPQNWRLHPAEQRNAMIGVLQDVGWVDSIIVNQKTNRVLNGHLRLEIALSTGEEKVPVKYVDLTEEEERKILATFDPLGSMASTDETQLGELLDTLKTDNEALNSLIEQLKNDTTLLELPPEIGKGEGGGFTREVNCPHCGESFIL